MLQKFQEFDGQLIHKKYQELVKEKSKSTKEEQI
jgi:hypothetical protein